MVFLSKLIALVLLAFTAPSPSSGYGVPDPQPSQVISASWGGGILPVQREVPYVNEAYLGCGYEVRHDACHGSQTLDIYPRTDGKSKGTFVFVHGGGFVGGDKFPMDKLGAILDLTREGWSVVSVNYRLASHPWFTYPAAAQDVTAALRWVEANAPTYGMDTKRLVVGGESAGGALAMLAAVTGNSEDSPFGDVPPLSGWVSLAGVIDFQAGPQSAFWGRAWMGGEQFVALREQASAVTWWDAADPRGYVVHGDLDGFVEYSGAESLYRRSVESKRIQFDSVDYWADGTFMPEDVRGHSIAGGMNAAAFQRWLDGLPTLERYAKP